MRTCVLIPARYDSSRFPGKPLAKIAGQPMIAHVYHRARLALSNVIVLTDHEKIAEACRQLGMNYMMTSPTAATGTDRIAEAARSLDADIFINVQGDEPLIDPKTIEDVLTVKQSFKDPSACVVNAMCEIDNTKDWHSRDVPKVVTASNRNLLYMSRAPIPMSKSGEFLGAKKQVCVYAYTRKELEMFVASGRRLPLEIIEDVEILRFLEMGHCVKMVEVPSGSIGVDRPEDIARVEERLYAAT